MTTIGDTLAVVAVNITKSFLQVMEAQLLSIIMRRNLKSERIDLK